MTAMTCTVEGCEKPQGDRRICYMHAHRWRLYRSYELPEPPTREEAFWSQVEKTPTCWLWTGAVDRRGYGRFSYADKTVGAHRLGYEIGHGESPAGYHVCHRCDNPPCVRPDHLFLGNDATNLADMAAKKRSNWGERHPSHKLTEDQVREIRAKVEAGGQPPQLAQEYGVTRFTIHDIARRRSWYHLD